MDQNVGSLGLRARGSPSSPGTGIIRMKDIADRGNVSLATVSRVLRGQGAERFSQATRDKVLRVAHELGWSPNRLVRGIQTGKTGMMGLVMVPFGEHWQRLIIGLHTQLLARDLLPLALYPDYNNTDDSATELALLRNFMELRVEGIACWPLMDRSAMDYLASVCANQVPVVTIDFDLPHTNAVAVRTPERKAMALALDHLMELGHKRIGFVGKCTPSSDWAVDRRNAFVHEMANRRLQTVFVEEISKGDTSALARLENDLRQVTAVIAGSEQLALSVWHVAGDAGLHIPQDLSILGFGQFNFEFALWPKFTSIDQRPEEIGRVAARLLVDPDTRMQAAAESGPGRRSSVAHIEVEPNLVVGQTTASPRS